MTISDIYGQASGVDIREQERLWDERGKGYYGEYLVFSEVFRYCSDQAKILTNVQIPYNGRSTEIDVLLIDTFGMISFEVKHYKGTIYGKSEEETWTQYFKTTSNEKFHSPVRQNDYHIAALRRHFPDVPIYSFVVFTNPEVNLKVINSRRDVTICTLAMLKNILPQPPFHQTILSADTIDGIFTACSEWASRKDNTVLVDGKEVPFTDYLRSMTTTFREEIQKEEKQKWQRRVSPLSIILTILGAAVLVIGMVLMLSGMNKAKHADFEADRAARTIRNAEASVSSMSDELSEMQRVMDKYFSTASWNNDGNIDLKEDFLEVVNCSMEVSKDLEKGTHLSITIKCNGTDFGLHIGGHSQLVLLLKDGRSVSGMLSNFTTNYIDSHLREGRTYTIPKLLIAGVDPSEIQYIKIIEAEITKVPETYLTVVEHFEFTIYEGE